MTEKCINYSAGLRYDHSPGNTALYEKIYDSLTPASVEKDIDDIKKAGCTSVRIYGDRADKLLMSAETALERGLSVWLSPRLINGTKEETIANLKTFAQRAEELRTRYEGRVTLVVGTELALDSRIALDGDYGERTKKYAALVAQSTMETRSRIVKLLGSGALSVLKRTGHIAAISEEEKRRFSTVGDFVRELAAHVRPIFHGPLTYAALPQEQIDWNDDNLDIVGVNLYRDFATGRTYEQELEQLKGFGKPVAITEFGTAPYKGAELLGGGAANQIIQWSRLRLLPHLRDTSGQARHIKALYRTYQKHDIDHAFVFEYRDRLLEALPPNLRDASFALTRMEHSGRRTHLPAYQQYSEL